MNTDADMIQTADWNDLWNKKLVGASWRRRQKDPVAYFDAKAKWYNQVVMGRSNHVQEILPRLVVDHGCSVLDIGSGPGILSIPLARTAGKVTAIDPSEQMLCYLKENVQKQGIKNITCLNKKWEDVRIGKDIENHDIVIASHSLAMLDLQEALFKMNRAANQRVYLFAFAGNQSSDYQELWPKLYNQPFVPGPDYIFIVNILYQMGITANLEIWEHNSLNRISSLDEAVKERLEYFDSPLPSAPKIIREHLIQKMIKKKDALWTEQRTKTAMIWWEKK